MINKKGEYNISAATLKRMGKLAGLINENTEDEVSEIQKETDKKGNISSFMDVIRNFNDNSITLLNLKNRRYF